jgi:predicted DNA-binding ribbon-helix-helix protein
VRPDPAADRPAKRSLTIRGHRTSVTLEDAFWEALREVAVAEGRSMAALVTEIDTERDPGTNLASAIRLRVLAHYRGPPES